MNVMHRGHTKIKGARLAFLMNNLFHCLSWCSTGAREMPVRTRPVGFDVTAPAFFPDGEFRSRNRLLRP